MLRDDRRVWWLVPAVVLTILILWWLVGREHEQIEAPGERSGVIGDTF